ncbi:SymE family type I addiction module toxin [Dyadobacter koreensis]|uniref:SymE family type I addiction module toxin n=1 Tax=Dyadobacter koreensis TaxID=408657 RepID=UPI000B83EDB6|nr:SymE family type I addiction module toxin [Dyadobacter koreensis]
MNRKVQEKAERRIRGIRFVPSLPLSGIRLESTGFQIGQEVNIAVINGQIIISP